MKTLTWLALGVAICALVLIEAPGLMSVFFVAIPFYIKVFFGFGLRNEPTDLSKAKSRLLAANDVVLFTLVLAILALSVLKPDGIEIAASLGLIADVFAYLSKPVARTIVFGGSWIPSSLRG